MTTKKEVTTTIDRVADAERRNGARTRGVRLSIFRMRQWNRVPDTA
jgi:hypothetical protein